MSCSSSVTNSRPDLRGTPPVLWGALVGSALIMVVGVVNLFGIEGVAAAAAATLVN